MTDLISALRAKYPNPQAVMRALGLDEALLREGKPDMKAPPKEAAARAGLKELIAQDANLQDIIEFIDAFKTVNAQGEAEQAEERPDAFEEENPAPAIGEEGKDEEGGEDQEAPMLEGNSGVPAVAKEGEGKEEKPIEAAPGEEKEIATDSPVEKLHGILKGKLSPEELAAVGELLEQIAGAGGAKDEDPEAAEDCNGLSKDESEKNPEEEKNMKAAMDAAIAAERKHQRAIRDAEREVRPHVGELAIAFDSAEDVYRHALKSLGAEKADEIKDGVALKALWNAYPKPGDRPRKAIAQDSAANDDYAKRFPHANRLKRA